MDVCPCALEAWEHGICPISTEGWQIAYTCMTLVQDMNGLVGGPTTAIRSRWMGHAWVYCSLCANRVWSSAGVNVSFAKPPLLMVVVTEYSMCGGLFWSESCRAVWNPLSVNEQRGGQADRQWSEISRWKPWGWLVGERLIHQSLQTTYVTFDAKLMKTTHWWLRNVYR